MLMAYPVCHVCYNDASRQCSCSKANFPKVHFVSDSKQVHADQSKALRPLRDGQVKRLTWTELEEKVA